MWKCSNCGESVEDNFDICWNCQTPKDGTEIQAEVTEEITEDLLEEEVEEEEAEVKYHFKTLLGYGKLISGLGWAVVILGIITIIAGLSKAEDAWDIVAIRNIIIIILGFGMAISGQVISCFVSIERNTRATYEILKKQSDEQTQQE